MEFIQIMELRTTRVDELQDLEHQWEQATEGRRTLRRAIVARDRNDPARHVVMAFFDSYDSAMQNSNLPETTEFGRKQAELLDAPVTYQDLDVVDDRTATAADAGKTAVADFASPAERRRPDKAAVDIVDLGGTRVARMAMQPGWKWSESIKPIVGTGTCLARHVGIATGGHLHVRNADGAEVDITAGEAYRIEPGHDAWVVGDEPFVSYEFEQRTIAMFATALDVAHLTASS